MKKTPTRDEFEEEVAKLPTEWAVRFCGFLVSQGHDAARMEMRGLAFGASVCGMSRSVTTSHLTSERE
jgi:hypothetical protein